MDRAFVHATLDRAYSVRAAWLLAGAFLPIAIVSAWKRLVRKGKISSIPGRPHAAEMTDFVRLGVPCVLASSPLAAFVFVITVILASLAVLPVKSAIIIAAVTASKHGGNHHNDNHPNGMMNHAA